METVDNFTKYFYGLLFCEILTFLDVRIKVAVVAILKDEVIIVGSLLHIVELDDIVALAALEDFNLALQQLFELAYLSPPVPLTP